jgi:DNA-binding MarR family transcriptional regulator
MEGVQVQSLTRLLNEFADCAGFVERSASDGRRVDITITEAGQDVLHQHVECFDTWLAS